MPILGQKYRHLDMSWLLIGHNRTAKVQIYLLIIKDFEKKVFFLSTMADGVKCVGVWRVAKGNEI